MTDTTLLTSEQRRAVHNLVRAQDALEKARQFINLALGETDVGNDYVLDLDGMCVELEMDIEDIYRRSQE